MDGHFVFRLLRCKILIYGALYLACFLQELCVKQRTLAHGTKGGSIRTVVPARFIDFLNLNGTLGECCGKIWTERTLANSF